MKRRDAPQEGGRGKLARRHDYGEATAGSHTIVRQGPTLSLQTSADGNDMIVDEAHAIEREHGGSTEEDEDEEMEGDEDEDEDENASDIEDASTIETLKLLLNRLSEISDHQRVRLVDISQRMLYSESDKGAKLHADSTEVRVQVYDAISAIVKTGKLPRNSISDVNTIRALITTAIAELNDRHHRIRSAVLQLVAHLAPMLKASDLPLIPTSKQQQGYSQHDIQLIISNYVTDPEPRVRKNACKALLDLHRQGFKLGLVMYDVAILALLDDYQEVRMEGLDLIYILSGLYPEQIVQNPFASQIQATRLVDDAFIRICDMVNDSSMPVRAKACSLLGRFKTVDYKFLSQTFSKQIMARLKVDVAPKNLAAGPAQKQAQRAKLIATPEGDQDVTAQQVRLLDSGACGAFVHGLEDEYQDVRYAAIDSICQLCLHNPDFSLLALDYMVDMFMDEIDHVRLNALTSLCKIGTKAPITFDTEQLQIALGVLEDADRDMFQFYAAANPQILSSKESMVPEMLNLNKMYLPIEQNVENMLYGGHLILIFNAATANPHILQMLPKYTYKHYTYLRDKYPNCFPEPSEIPCPGTQPLRDLASALILTIAKDSDADKDVTDSGLENIVALNSVSSAYETTIAAMRVQTEQDAEAFYDRALENLDRIYALWRDKPPLRQSFGLNASRRTMTLQQIAVCQRDLRYIVNVHAAQARNAEYADMFLECCDLLARIQDSYDTPSFVMLAPVLSGQLFRLSYYMDHTFVGVDATTKVSVGFFRVLANLVWFFGMAQQTISTSLRDVSARVTTSTQRTQVERGPTREYLQSMLRMAIKRITDLLAQMDQPEVDMARTRDHRVMIGDLRISMLRAFESPSTREITRLMSNIARFVPLEVDFRSLRLQRIGADVQRPLSNRDNPTEVHPSFPFLVPVEGLIHHISDTSGVAVQVTFPQDVVRHYYPPADHFTLLDEDEDDPHPAEPVDEGDAAPSNPPSRGRTYRLRTSIEIYPDANWGTTAAELRIALTRSFRPDLVGHDEFICRFAEEVVFEKRQRQQQQTSGAAVDGQSRQSFLAQDIPLPGQQSALERSTAVNLQMLRGHSASTSSSLTAQQSQSTLEISKSIAYYVSRRAMFSQ
ncbi:Integrator complex subunit 4 [Dissophora globulifera]|uniref:Integrator complex subunit 4 n=1 Tax=Dissophora globulifera TaxID=979702 RepID=A0A9P6UM23_9FUNG|nr:Integrator complex subunit 4 [Dissophora globulifera]